MEISALVPIQRTVLATTTPFLTSTFTAGVCKQECTAGIFLAYTKKKGPPQFKNSFPASVRYATLIRNSSLNLKKSVTVACERPHVHRRDYRKDSKLAGWQDSIQGYLLELELA